MTEELPVLQLLRKPSVTVNLDRVEQQLQGIMEQTKLAQAFPVALLDSQKLENIILSTVQAYGQALRETLQSFRDMHSLDNEKLSGLTRLLEQNTTQFGNILGMLTQISQALGKLGENTDLEREVLQKLNQQLSS